MPERIDFWGIPHTWGPPELYVYTLMALATLILIYRSYQRFRLWWEVGRSEVRWDHLPTRFGRLINYAILQSKVLRQRYPGLMHIAIAWSFFVFFLGTALATIHSHFFKFLQGNIYLVYKFVLDSFTLFFLIGAILAAYRRYIQKPPRLTLQPKFTWSFVLIIIIVIGGLLTESLRLAIEQPAWAIWTPLGWLVAQVWIATGTSDTTLLNWHLGIWGFHLVTVFITLITLPVSTLSHILTGPLNVFFSKVDRTFGQPAPIPQDSKGELIYVSKLGDLTWKQLLDGDACTECGRCQDACPAFATGTPLNPKELILSIRDTLHRNEQNYSSLKTKQLVGERIKNSVIWSCMTCGACVHECPVLIEHIDTIIDFRRYLVIEGQVDDMLQDALTNLGRYSNSFGQSERMRVRWTKEITPQIKDARKENVEYLWFVGDYASYHANLIGITQKTAILFQKAGIDFGILYEAERNAGNDVRRVGEEGLFEILVEKNMVTLGKCTFKNIITTDPHTYNALKNEYPKNLNGHNRILHYSELLDQLISLGKLNFKRKLDYKVTYHDPCYLGRYNQIYDCPRRVIAATGCLLVEMPRHRDTSFCCGAGGGRIWMEDIPDIRERPAEVRIREAASLPGVNTLIVACPKDYVMFQDAVKTSGLEGKLIVKDLIEIVGEALELEEV